MQAASILDEESSTASSDTTATETTGLLSSTPAASGGSAQNPETPDDSISKKTRTSERGAPQATSAPRIARSVPTPVRQVNFQATPRSRKTIKVERAACKFCQYTFLIACLGFLTYWMVSSLYSVPSIGSNWGWFVDDDNNLLPGNDDNSTHIPSQLPTPYPTPTAPPFDDENENLRT